jgi:hypothetical protein
MKRLLQLGFILGLAGTLAAAYFTPWVQYERYRSAASVVANGGRVEQFVVRLPADRIGLPIAANSTAGDFAADAPRLEHFKLRDTEDNVIGIAARHAVAGAGGEETAWLLTIPSRGTIALAASGAGSIDAALAGRGLVAGAGLNPALSIDIGPAATSVAATGEFRGIDFELVETWVVTGLEDDGQVRGTLRLNTIGKRAT